MKWWFLPIRIEAVGWHPGFGRGPYWCSVLEIQGTDSEQPWLWWGNSYN
jgi:hypothetical protein